MYSTIALNCSVVQYSEVLDQFHPVGAQNQKAFFHNSKYKLERK